MNLLEPVKITMICAIDGCIFILTCTDKFKLVHFIVSKWVEQTIRAVEEIGDHSEMET